MKTLKVLRRLLIKFINFTRNIRLRWFLAILSLLLSVLIYILQVTYTNFLNQEKDRLNYSQSLIKLTEKRAYLAQNYYNNYKEEKDFDLRKEKLWQDYADSVTEYNINLIPSLVNVKKNYGDEVQKFYEQEVFNRLRTIHIELGKIRTDDSFDKRLLEENLDTIYNRKYHLAEILINCEPNNIYENLKSFAERLFNSQNVKCKIN